MAAVIVGSIQKSQNPVPVGFTDVCLILPFYVFTDFKCICAGKRTQNKMVDDDSCRGEAAVCSPSVLSLSLSLR